jgi:hypothetical protein
MLPAPASRDPVNWSANQEVRHNREERGDDENLQRMNPSENDHFVDDIHDYCQDEDSDRGSPTFAQKVNSVIWINQQSPKVRRPPLASILKSGPNREQGGHRRLQNDPKSHRPADAVAEVFPKSGH